MEISIKIMEFEEEYIANCPELDISCYGKNKGEAVRRIINVLRFYIESARELGLEVDKLDSIQVDGETAARTLYEEDCCAGSTLIN